MSLSKAVIMGEVVRAPEKRFTTNNVPITFFAININLSGTGEPVLVRIIARGKLAEKTAEIKNHQVIIVEGRLQTNTTKSDTGVEKRGVEIDASAVEVTSNDSKTSVKEDSQDFNYSDNEINDNDLIGEDEIPF